jgi:hypothetical protein
MREGLGAKPKDYRLAESEQSPYFGLRLSLRLGEVRFLARNMILGISSLLNFSCQPSPNTQRYGGEVTGLGGLIGSNVGL